MEQILQTLKSYGVSEQTIDALRDSNDKENALILLMEDDRREYVD